MRTISAALATVALTVGVVAPATAHPLSEVLPPLTVDLTHEATDNVGFVARFPEHAGSAGGAVTQDGDVFVITDPRGLFTYDISDPRSPELLGTAVVNQSGSGTGAALAQEDPPTDGKLVLVDGTSDTTAQLAAEALAGSDDPTAPNTDYATGGLHIFDISDPSNIELVGTHPATDHTWVCVTDVTTGNGCAFAYGRSDNIIDIRDPANPVKVEGWKTQIGDSNYTHDLTEIRPGLVMSAGAKPVLLDTTDPANPIELVRVDENDHGSDFVPTRTFPSLGYHSVEWAQDGHDDFLIMGTEIAPSGTTNLAGSDCEGENSVIESWDARPVVAALAEYDALVADGTSRTDAADAVFGSDRDAVNFELLDAYDATGRGLFTTGQAAGQVLYCAHWMEYNPSWEDGGRLVVGYYNRGVRFVDVAPFGGEEPGGTMTEHGWFVGADAYTGSAQWVTDQVVYVSDYARGLDIIELVDSEATGTYTADSALGQNAMTMAELEAAGIAPPAEDGAPYALLVAAGLALAAGAALHRRRATVDA